ncbi:MAG: choice-of-anchor J domain-containing protein, partial [Candidatus Cloacimonetes bacterium]|nr:choice-of-anchor J domain-containing protein [Candidatus Cloacimonadota bacterium]
MKRLLIISLILTMTISILLAIENPVVQENFDTVSIPQLPDNWSSVVFTSQENTTWEIQTIAENESYSAHSAPNVAIISNGGTVMGDADPGAFIGLATPQFFSGEYGSLLRFWTGGMNPLKIGYMTNLQDTASFVELREEYLQLPWHQVQIFIPAGLNAYVVFKHANWYANHDVWVDDVSICPISNPVLSFSDNFDTLNSPELPQDWFFIKKHDNLNSNTVLKTDNSDFYSSPNCLYMKNGMVMGQYLDPNAKLLAITPLIQLGTNGNRLNFIAKGANPVKVGVMTNPTDENTFVEISEVALNNETWTECSVTIPYQNNVFVAFKHANLNSNTIIRIDNIVISPIISDPVFSINENFDQNEPPALPQNWTALIDVLPTNPVASISVTGINSPSLP